MEWIRRRARWPRVAALLLLFGLTVAAPRCWHWLREQRSPSAATALDDRPTPIKVVRIEPLPAETVDAATTLPAIHDAGPELPPVVVPSPASRPAPRPASAPLLEDDYALVDDPLPPRHGAGAFTLSNQVEAMPSMAPLATSSGPRLPPPERTAPTAPPTPPAIPAPAQPAPDVTQLLAMRDAVAQLVAGVRQIELPRIEPPAPRIESPVPVRVQVTSEYDRLAMAPPREEGEGDDVTPTERSPHDSPIEPEAEAHVAARQAPRPLLVIAPTVLAEQLEQAADLGQGMSWAAEALALLPTMTAPEISIADAEAALAQFDRLAAIGLDEALAVRDPAEQRTAIRAAKSLARRLPLWHALVAERQAGVPLLQPHEAVEADAARVMQLLHEFAALTAGSDAGTAWRDYLLLDQLAALASVGGADRAAPRRQIARRFFARIESDRLTDAQRAFLAASPAPRLAEALAPWATGPVKISTLAALVERYELRGAQRDADLIAELQARLAHGGDPRLAELADQLDRAYRNGNMRLAVTEDLLNRLTPQPAPQTTPVHERIAGIDVRGRARTTTKLAVRLTPDPHQWNLGIEAAGAVQSQTYSKTWPAKVRNNGRVEYEARKDVKIGAEGVQLAPAEARTGTNRSTLAGVDSTFEPLPIVGALVENYAIEKNQERRPRALSQVRIKVQRTAKSRLDREADAKLSEFEEQFRTTVLEPLEKISLAVEPLEMYTTDQRAVMRLRMADAGQLGAHTPRPSAPGDSLASVQLHESALNNAARGLGLEGCKFTSAELYETLAQRLGRPMAPPQRDLSARATVTFANTDAARLRCHGDRIELTLSIAELAQGRDRIRNVEVHAFFRPVVEGLELKLVRDGSLQFNGPRLLTGPRIVLHSVFGKLLPKDQEVVLLAPHVDGDPRFAGLMVTQLVIEDGWIALALGPESPERTAWRSDPTTTESR